MIRRIRALLIPVLVVVLFAGWNALVGTAARAAASFEKSACFLLVGSEPAICGNLIVPENRHTTGGRTIRLPVIVLRAKGSDAAGDPVVFINGGPGGATISDSSWIDFWIEEKRSKPWLAKRDLVLFDARGAGRAKPSLECRELDRLPPEFFSLPSAGPATLDILNKAMLACRDRLLADGIDLQGYNTQENVADVLDLVSVLGVGSGMPTAFPTARAWRWCLCARIRLSCAACFSIPPIRQTSMQASASRKFW